MSLTDPDGTIKSIVAIILIAAILVAGTLEGFVTESNGLAAVILAIIAAIVTHSLGQQAGRSKGLVGVALSLADTDGTAKAVVAMIVIGGLEIFMLLRGVDGSSMQAVVILVATIAGYTQGAIVGHARGVTQLSMAKGPPSR